MGIDLKSAKLYRAVRNADWDKAVGLIAAGAQPNEKAVRYANKNRHPEWSALLLTALQPAYKGFSPADRLFEATLRADWEQAKPLLDAGIVPSDSTINLVVRHFDKTDWLKNLLEALAKAGRKPPSESLHIAFKQDSEVKADMLIAAGAVPNEETLHDAAYCWSVDTAWVRKLLETGAPVTQEVLAAAFEFPELGKIRALLKAGAVPDEQTMMLAIGKLETDMAEMLLDAYVDADRTPTADMLTTAMVLRRFDTGKALIARGVVPSENLLCYVASELGRECARELQQAAENYKKKSAAAAYNAAAEKPQKADAPKLVLRKASRQAPTLKLRKGPAHG